MRYKIIKFNIDNGPGYIPTAITFREGGYEVNVSKLTPQDEVVLMAAMKMLLNAKP